jgi:Ca2+-binding RTX toxin-like protein
LSLTGDDTLLGGPGKDIVNGGNLAEPFGGDKTLVGGDGNDAVEGGLGSDNMVAQDGNDFVLGGEFAPPAAKDALSGGAGSDVIDVFNKPAGEDVASCGGGFDRVFADRADILAPDCERVFVGERKFEAFSESIPESFWEGLHPRF